MSTYQHALSLQDFHGKKIPNEDLLSIYLRFQDTDGNLYITCLQKQEEDYIIVHSNKY
jgi:hypothetical protein